MFSEGTSYFISCNRGSLLKRFWRVAFPLEAWKTPLLCIYLFSYTVYETPARTRGRDSGEFLTGGGGGPGASSYRCPRVSVGVVPGGTDVISERKSIFLISPPKRISIKMSFQVFTVSLLIPFCFWHQTTNFQPLKWMVGSIAREFFLTTGKSCTCVSIHLHRGLGEVGMERNSAKVQKGAIEEFWGCVLV